MNDEQKQRVYKAIGLMSGTSLDGIDVGIIDTDGKSFVRSGPSHYVPYPGELKTQIRACFGKTEPDVYTQEVEETITLLHAEAVKEFMRNEEIDPATVKVVGFHGQTITHKPKEGFTWQLGDGQRLATEIGIDVVNQFRVADVKAGGEGAPLIPLFHQALARQKKVKMPIVFLNIGGVANVTWMGPEEDNILAFDTGPGNALMDDFMQRHFGLDYDFAGTKAKLGEKDLGLLAKWLSHPFLAQPAPKSLDRGFLPEKGAVHVNADMNVWDISGVLELSPEDAMATLADFTASTIAAAAQHFPEKAHAWYVCGGGRHNDFLMKLISEKVDAPVKSINDLGYNGDAVESEGFAYLAVRHILDLPLSLPTTTGVKEPTKGGVFYSK